ncbi:hypothetical protein IID04_05900 [PVC group bacterium]|nr:hypothetical protein [PVC group bacterium]MCH7590160.1 hypothetical protein [PVC group bacterium]
MSDFKKAIKVASVLEEYRIVSEKKCFCGGKFERKEQALLQHGTKYYDKLRILCKKCGFADTLIFDINSFFKFK